MHVVLFFVFTHRWDSIMVFFWKNAIVGAIAFGSAAAANLNIGSGGQTIQNLKGEVSKRHVL